MRWRVTVIVRLREGLNDPEGRVIGNALRNLGYAVENLRVPKYFEFELESEKPEEEVEEMCRKLLANPLIHDYEYSIEPVN
ncbi:phosphoribosylformylglycinamidine synthase subunit PurS [Thermococcus sp. 4557]|uniref:phosphoribosylformylglycinamidine synthase subunit PurS n=1 Tax=Thermococcus sp. (strain CGMCC 1.5172 / 4557) TaxID=1042877 RepID=UPI000219EE6B|nr:phosphoribosylformylglycinamidine synthase subunit PurS [Thermococcus sp. 4557]AEK73052.1 phosphoribosylformylglycinamidine synthase subunit PurS [Thermococcus sp. 4557]